jgi:tetratricopeptide (TPR) repeat protein
MEFERRWHYACGWIYQLFGQGERASVAYASAFRLDAQDVRSARHIAFIAAQKCDDDAALRWFDAALSIAPEDADTHFNRGFLLGRMERPDAALKAFAEAVRLRPALDRAWYGMGMTWATLGDHAKAIPALSEAARLQPMNGQAHYQLGMAFHHNGQPEQLERTLHHLLECNAKLAHQLVRDSGRNDLVARLPELPF